MAHFNSAPLFYVWHFTAVAVNAHSFVLKNWHANVACRAKAFYRPDSLLNVLVLVLRFVVTCCETPRNLLNAHSINYLGQPTLLGSARFNRLIVSLLSLLSILAVKNCLKARKSVKSPELRKGSTLIEKKPRSTLSTIIFRAAVRNLLLAVAF